MNVKYILLNTSIRKKPLKKIRNYWKFLFSAFEVKLFRMKKSRWNFSRPRYGKIRCPSRTVVYLAAKPVVSRQQHDLRLRKNTDFIISPKYYQICATGLWDKSQNREISTTLTPKNLISNMLQDLERKIDQIQVRQRKNIHS